MFSHQVKDSLLFFDTYKKAIVLNIYSGKKLLDIDKKTGVYNGYQPPEFVKSNLIVTKEDKNVVSAYAILNKKKLWTFTAPDPIANKPILKGDTVFFCDKTKLYAVDITSGNQLWEMELRGEVSSALYIDKNFLYVWAVYRGLLACSISNHEIAWEYNNFETQYGNYNLLFHGDTIFFANEHIYAINKNTAKLIWQSDEDCVLKSNYIASTAYYILYYDGCSNDETDIISAVDKQTGKKIYQGFTSAIFPSDNPNNPNNLADIEYALFKFSDHFVIGK